MSKSDSADNVAAILLSDPYEAVGGGQVVLQQLARTLHGMTADPVLVVPEGQYQRLSIPTEIVRADSVEAGLAASGKSRYVLVSNATRGYARDLRQSRRLESRGVQCTKIAIVHAYPRNLARRVATRALLSQYDKVIVVEPGLADLARDPVIPPWLGLDGAFEFMDAGEASPLTHEVKVFARPDKSKGLHLLPRVFQEAERLGFSCHVALGTSTEGGQQRYEASLRTILRPWLVEGRRGPGWLMPGDLYIAPSMWGEAACLAAQECLGRGALVMASRLGLLPYLASSFRSSLVSFDTGSAGSAIKALREIDSWSGDEVMERTKRTVAELESRAGLWHRSVASLLVTSAGRAYPVDRH